MPPHLADWLVVAVIGVAVGAGDLVGWYRDAPVRALTTGPGLLYIAVHAASSLVALSLIRAFDWTFALPGSETSEGARWTQVLVAGCGAIALFRSSFLVTRVGNEDVSVGPSTFLKTILAAAERAVDRKRAQARAVEVRRVLAHLSFAEAHEALPSICLALMQDLSAEEQEAFGNQVRELRESGMDDQSKLFLLGVAIVNLMGEDVLREAVDTLRSRQAGGADPSPLPSDRQPPT